MMARHMKRYALIAVAALAIAAMCQFDDIDDNGTEYAESAALKELQAAQAGSARQKRAGQALCNEARGPNSEARWTPDGDLVCTTRRGVVTANATAQVQP